MTVPTSAIAANSRMLELPGLDVDLDLGEPSDVGPRLAVARIGVACGSDQAPAPPDAAIDVFVQALMSSGAS